jgi:methylthioribose-1-phosphate isomerase
VKDHIHFDSDTGVLHLLDQRLLPSREQDFAVASVEDVIFALQAMVVRGAPAIGVTAAYGCVIAARQAARKSDWKTELDQLVALIAQARPTAVNLSWAVGRMRALWDANPGAGPDELAGLWLAEAGDMQAADIEANRAMGRHGQALLKDGDTVMTHCNAGALATAGHGTALGVVYSAVEAGKRIRVIANETRPFLQGARLSAFELEKAGVEVSVACDNACGLLMKKGLVDKVVVGADRIAANGDVANKIGTYSVALLAKAHDVPFYVAAPSSTFDLATPHGDLIPIEERTPREVTHPTDESCIVPQGVAVHNFAFDVTPAGLIAGIITEKGVLTPPYTEAIARVVGRQ